jgi:predicted phosphodiesterase
LAWKRWVCAGDVHGDKQDKGANDAFFKFADLWRPDYRIMAGDLWDFRPLRKGASPDERRESMQDDYDAGKEWLERFRPTRFLRGNHDERLWELAKYGDGLSKDYACKGVIEIEALLAKMRCQMQRYSVRENIFQIGSLKVCHGFGRSGLTAARRHAQAYGSILLFHFHTIQQSSIEGLENRIGRVCGALCQLDMEYNERNIGSLMGRHGWPYGVVNDRTGHYHMWQAEQIDGKWLVPSDIVEL